MKKVKLKSLIEEQSQLIGILVERYFKAIITTIELRQEHKEDMAALNDHIEALEEENKVLAANCSRLAKRITDDNR